MSKLRKLAKTCNYGELEQSLIRDRIVCGIIDNTARKRLLQEVKLTLTECIDKALESTCAKLKTMTGAKSAEATEDIKALRHKSSFYKNKQNKPQKHTKQRNCIYCGKQCTKGKCPAYGTGLYNNFFSNLSLWASNFLD